jgi:hypothetical protein
MKKGSLASENITLSELSFGHLLHHESSGLIGGQ